MQEWLPFVLACIAILSAQPRHATSLEYNRALGVECAHCHGGETYSDDTKPQFAIARNMSVMAAAVNERLGGEKVSCWTCHRGEVKPSRLPRAPLDAELAKWPAELASAPESQKLAMTVYDVTLGVGCDHCHASDWKSREKDPIKTTATMNGLFEIFPKYMPEGARTQCFMCHKGSKKPPFKPSSEVIPKF